MLVKQVRHDPWHPKLFSLIVENLPVFDQNNNYSSFNVDEQSVNNHSYLLLLSEY